MPSKSLKQHKLMVAACHDKEFADKVKIDQKTACEFVRADKENNLYDDTHPKSKQKKEKK